MNWECRQCPAHFSSRVLMSDHLVEAHPTVLFLQRPDGLYYESSALSIR